MTTLPDRCEVVVIGGGVIGVSVAYHLAEAGIQDVVLVERKELTSGTTWHAAGLVGQLRSSINMTKLARYTSELYRGLEAETGQATGYRQCGSMSIAATAERFEELKRSASMAKVFDLEVNVLSVRRVPSCYQMIHRCCMGPSLCPSERFHAQRRHQFTPALHGSTDAVEIPPPYSVCWPDHRCGRLCRKCGNGVAGWAFGCGGYFGCDPAVNLPLHACEHYYVLFESVAGLHPDLPVLRDYDACTYYKYDAGKLLLGAFEPSAKPWGMGGISEDFSFGEFPDDFDHFEPILEAHETISCA